jgi:hypothetical protein
MHTFSPSRKPRQRQGLKRLGLKRLVLKRCEWRCSQIRKLGKQTRWRQQNLK